MTDHLQKVVTWSKTNDPTAQWRSEVGSEIWIVRVNDFPEEHLYTLLVNGKCTADFDEWPETWNRT